MNKNYKKLKTSLPIFLLLFLCSACKQDMHHLDIQLDLYTPYGTMTPEKQQQIFHQPHQIQASYKAILAIPWITATIERCGFLQLPCLQKKFISKNIQGLADPQKQHIYFRVPEYVKWLYKLNTVNYTLPNPPATDTLNQLNNVQLTIQTAFTAGGGAQREYAISIGTAYEGLLGTLHLSKSGYETTQDVSADLILTENSPPYQFARHHQYYGYMQNNNIQRIENTQVRDYTAAISEKITGVENVYEATKYTTSLGKQVFENYVIRAKLKDNTACNIYPSFEYNLFYIDQRLVNFSSQVTNTSICQTLYRGFSLFENGEIDTYTHDVYDQHSNQFHYAQWNYLCPKRRQSLLGQCRLKKPTTEEIQLLEKQAQDIQHWFQP